ncbi:coagulation factor XIII B chain-like isoform X2 [Polypterus senegalus]|uniref:coagulation factor XIII B chain-like isoform X2 n=1 Tax=Polypterus senegalus TaxID=55291 RepID=UPI0019668A66|nr:coagulation factor XIII B chain-like isoform X2 [Polypterus senegalus]
MRNIFTSLLILAFCTRYCTSVTSPGKDCTSPDISHAQILPNKTRYAEEETLFYACEKGYKTSKGFWWGETQCTSGKWQPNPECIDERIACPQPPHVENTVITTKPKLFVNKDKIEYMCIFTGEMLSNACEKGMWKNNHQCSEFCSVPQIFDGFPHHPSKRYFYGDKLEYECNKDYRRSDVASECTRRGWKPTPQCTILTCEVPYITSGRISNPVKEYNVNETLQYFCTGNFKRSRTDPVCTVEGWKPKPVCNDGRCFLPPKIDNGDIKEDINSWYKDGAEVPYQCKENYVMEGDSVVKCSVGDWSKPPQCMKPCFLMIQKQPKTLKHKEELKIICPNRKQTTLICENGKPLNTCPS